MEHSASCTHPQPSSNILLPRTVIIKALTVEPQPIALCRNDSAASLAVAYAAIRHRIMSARYGLPTAPLFQFPSTQNSLLGRRTIGTLTKAWDMLIERRALAKIKTTDPYRPRYLLVPVANHRIVNYIAGRKPQCVCSIVALVSWDQLRQT